jgi:hypothetical protein
MAEYIITMNMELHLADYYGQDLILVSKLSTYAGNNKLFKLMTGLDVRAFTNSFRKTNVSDSINGLGVITCLDSSNGILSRYDRLSGVNQKLLIILHS